MKAGLFIFFFFIIFNLFGQNEEIKREIKYTTEVGAIVSTTGETPFWLRANQYGIVSSQSPIVTLRGSVTSDYKKAITKEDHYKLSKFDWGYGLNVVGNVGKENQLLIPEAYVKAKYGAFEIYGGRRREIVGLVDTTFSSGSYIWSGNALPMPKIQISTPNFVPLGFTKGFLSFKGSYAHGCFENSRTDVKNFYLHQKSLYFRLGKPDWKFHFYGGFNHQVQWGGELLYADPLNQSAFNGQVGSGFNNYLNVVVSTSLSLGEDSITVGTNDAGNRSGNHLGTVDFGFDIQASNYTLLVYRQNIYETGTLYYLSNISDGLQGISFTNKKTNSDSKIRINKFVFEYLNTYSQGGEIGYYATNGRLRGKVLYFNNVVYRDGWVYNQNTIGSPFVSTFNNNIPKYPSIFKIHYNRLETFFVGLNFNVNKIFIESKFSLSHYFGFDGINTLTKTTNQYSGLINANIPVKILNESLIIGSIGYDNGAIINDNLGIYIGLKKKW